MTTVIEGAAGKIAVEAIKFAAQKGVFRNMVNKFKKKHRVLVLGVTGAGKTNFLSSLVSKSPEAIYHLHRTSFVTSHTMSINGNLFVFTDTPGEAENPRRDQAMREAMSTGINGVINVVSYGYHEYGRGKEGVISADGKPDEQFLQERRDVECAYVRKWVNLLGSVHTIDWLITLVNKADLWWDRRETVMKHYVSGEYAKELQAARDLAPLCVDYCSVIHRFYGESILPGIFDDGNRVRLRNSFGRTLLEAIGKGKLDD